MSIYLDLENKINCYLNDKLSEQEIINFIFKYLNSNSAHVYHVLYDKLHFFSKNMFPNSNYRKFIKLIIKLNNDPLISFLETKYLKSMSIENFLIFIEELIIANKNTSEQEDNFIHLMNQYQFGYENTNKFLKILSKDKKWLIQKVLSFDMITLFIELIHESESHNENYLSKFSDVLLEKENYKNNTDYIKLIINILIYSSEFLEKHLFYNKIDKFDFEFDLIKERNISAIANYCNFIYNKSISSFLDFEKKYINSHLINSFYLIDYANKVPICSERLILKRLIELKAEKELISFINKFPKYKKLLPVL